MLISIKFVSLGKFVSKISSLRFELCMQDARWDILMFFYYIGGRDSDRASIFIEGIESAHIN